MIEIVTVIITSVVGVRLGLFNLIKIVIKWCKNKKRNDAISIVNEIHTNIKNNQ